MLSIKSACLLTSCVVHVLDGPSSSSSFKILKFSSSTAGSLSVGRDILLVGPFFYEKVLYNEDEHLLKVCV